MEQTKIRVIAKNATVSLFIYVLPIVLMIAAFYFSGQRPWEHPGKALTIDIANTNSFLGLITSTFNHIQTWGLTVIVLVLAVAEFSLGAFLVGFCNYCSSR